MLLDSKPKNNKNNQDDRFSKIPTMASAISKKITSFRENYRKLVDEAAIFFESYQDQYKSLKKLKANIKAYQDQIDIIENYRKEKGKLPKIKDQPSTDRYLRRLSSLQAKLEDDLHTLETAMQHSRNQRYEMLDHLTDQILDLLDGQRIFSQLLGTIALSSPSPEDKVRHVRNEKYKPIYITALTIALFEEARHHSQFQTPYIKNRIGKLFQSKESFSLMAEKGMQAEHSKSLKKPMPPELKMAYREEVLKPIAKASLLQSIGSHCPEVNAIFDGDRYRQLDDEERTQLINTINSKTLDYIKLGIGIPNMRFDTKEARAKFIKEEKEKVLFMLETLRSLNSPKHELGDLIRIPMVYSSILLSTKEEFDYQQVYQAYDIIEQGKTNNQYHSEYVSLFLNMVGRFPLGSGIYFIQQETGEIERAIVSSLYPADINEPICKQITRRQLQFLTQAEVIVSSNSNLFFKETRHTCHYDVSYFNSRFHNEFTWNATELWEVQIPAIDFWKKDGSRKYNGIYNKDIFL